MGLAALGVEEEVLLLHGAVETITRCYRDADITMTPTRPVSALPRSEFLAGRLVLPPGSSLHLDEALSGALRPPSCLGLDGGAGCPPATRL